MPGHPNLAANHDRIWPVRSTQGYDGHRYFTSPGRLHPGDQFLGLRQHAADHHIDAGGGRVDAVGLIERTVARDALEDERIEDADRARPPAPDRSDRTPWRNRARDCAAPACRRAAPRCARSFSLRMIASSVARVCFGSLPRSASLAPSSRITASVPSGTDQSSRASPPAAVSPETPAFSIATSCPSP